MGQDPSVPLQSSSLPQVLSTGVGLLGGKALGPQEDRGGTSSVHLCSAPSQVTQAQHRELGRAWPEPAQDAGPQLSLCTAQKSLIIPSVVYLIFTEEHAHVHVLFT